MTTIVQNVKYMQAIYRKYQIFAIVCAVLTLITAFLAAFSGIQLNNLRKAAQTRESANATITSSQVSADFQKELKETKLFLKSSQQQLSEEKEKVERLQSMLNNLERQLSAAQAKAALKTDPVPVPKPETSSSVSPTPKARRHGSDSGKLTPTPTPTAKEVQPHNSDDPSGATPAPDSNAPASPAPPDEKE